MSKNSKVLALKYRPQVFEDIIGQNISIQTIFNSIKSKKVPNAYLFTGIRGVGKTTIARIVAKSLNCKNGIEKLCKNNFCENCKNISDSNHIDVLEMDAASKTGVDDVRDLIDFSRYGPTMAKYKIFIIDEVHMLSKQAFNALLKTLEEPPKHVKFVFATTEANKVLPTIVSRCQRFEFRSIPVDLIVDKLSQICDVEKIKVDQEALNAIARMAQGGMRDAQSILDQMISFCGKEIKQENVLEVYGLVARERIVKLGDHIFEGNFLKD